MPSKARLYLDTYGASFMEQERIYRYRKTTWDDVIRNLVIDRGILLGSTNFEEMSGVEQAEALGQIDTAITKCYDHIEALRLQRDFTIPIKWGFRHRCARVRRRISDMDDDTLGKTREDTP